MKVLVVLAALCTLAYGLGLSDLGLGSVTSDGDIEDFPYAASVLISDQYVCTATIISAKWALTAARCVYKTPASWVTLRAGSNSSGHGGVVEQAENITVHPDYDPIRNINYNIALIMVSYPFPVGNLGVGMIGLAKSVPQTGQTANVSGWSKLNPQLQYTSEYILAMTNCQQYPYVNTALVVCAGAPNLASCQGAIGGPLVSGEALVGFILGFDINCIIAPIYYTNVAAYRDWIYKVAKV